MTPALANASVAGDHRQRTGDGLPGHLFGPAVDDHRPALLAVRAKGLAGQALARLDPLVDGELLVIPGLPIVEQGRFDGRHACPVRIRLGRDVLAGSPGLVDHGQEVGRVGAPAGIGVHDVERRPGIARRLQRLDEPLQPGTHVDV